MQHLLQRVQVNALQINQPKLKVLASLIVVLPAYLLLHEPLKASILN